MTRRFIEANGQRLAVWEREGEGVPLFLAHATGFHAHTWNQIIERLPGRRTMALDMRGHGESSKPAPPYSWRSFGEDVARLAEAISLRGVIGVGHSMGAHSLVLAESLAPGTFAELVLIDPVIMPPDYYMGRDLGPHFSRKRRNRWSSVEEMFERFRERPPFRDWDQAVLHDYCRWGLLPDGDGFVLACPPEVEASVYEHSGAPDASLYGILESIEAPVTVVRSIRGRMTNEGPIDMAASPTAPDLWQRFRHGHEIPVDLSHFIPMESPELVADVLSGQRTK